MKRIVVAAMMAACCLAMAAPSAGRTARLRQADLERPAARPVGRAAAGRAQHRPADALRRAHAAVRRRHGRATSRAPSSRRASSRRRAARSCTRSAGVTIRTDRQLGRAAHHGADALGRLLRHRLGDRARPRRSSWRRSATRRASPSSTRPATARSASPPACAASRPAGRPSASSAGETELVREGAGRAAAALSRRRGPSSPGSTRSTASADNGVKPWTFTDVTAVAGLLGQVFGAGGGREVRSSHAARGAAQPPRRRRATRVWRDLRSATRSRTARHHAEALPVRHRARRQHARLARRRPGLAEPVGAARGRGVLEASRARRRMPLLIGRKRSATGHPLAVMGPQLGYFYPELFMEVDAHGGGIDVRGGVLPGHPVRADRPRAATTPGAPPRLTTTTPTSSSRSSATRTARRRRAARTTTCTWGSAGR